MEELACNFLASLAHPPWANPLQRKLCLSYEGEERVPFDLYVQTHAATSSSPCQDSPSLAWSTLPTKLQLHVLTFCSAPALFQLMRVSSLLRKEASELFWAHPGAYFVIDALWLFEGGHAGYTMDDLGCLAKVENVQIDCAPALDDRIYPKKSDGTFEVRHDRIASFWSLLQKTCPRVKRVVISRSRRPNKDRNEMHSVPQAIQLLARSAPRGIMMSAFVVEQVDERADISSSGLDAICASLPKWQRALYQPRSDGSWEKTKSRQNWKVVPAPAKPFSGPVGRFYKTRYTDSRLLREEDGLRLIMACVLYHHLSHGEPGMTFPCTINDCYVRFQNAGEWTLHKAVMHRTPWNYQGWAREAVYELLPEEIKAKFEHRATMAKERKEENDRRIKEMREEWAQSSHEEQTELKRLWAEQLENDPLWETGEEDYTRSNIWAELCRTFQHKN